MNMKAANYSEEMQREIDRIMERIPPEQREGIARVMAKTMTIAVTTALETVVVDVVGQPLQEQMRVVDELTDEVLRFNKAHGG